MVDFSGATDRQIHSINCVGRGSQNTPHPRHYSHLQADLIVHDDHIAQGVTDSYISVISHESQENAFSTPKSKEEKYLGSTGKTRDGLPPGEKVNHHFWNGTADEGQVHKGKLAEQKVHWGVEPQVHGDQEQQSRVPCDCSEVNQNDSIDKDADELHIREESQENKICCQCLVHSLHGYD